MSTTLGIFVFVVGGTLLFDVEYFGGERVATDIIASSTTELT
tara:strand:+ start:423 stop:548 length:126 start_codon:yes stop_codon:yes gene_type:complete